VHRTGRSTAGLAAPRWNRQRAGVAVCGSGAGVVRAGSIPRRGSSQMAIHIDAAITSTATRTTTIATPKWVTASAQSWLRGIRRESAGPQLRDDLHDRLSLITASAARIPRTAGRPSEADVPARGFRSAGPRHVHGPDGATPDAGQQRDDRHAADDVDDDGGENLAGRRHGLSERRGGRDHVGQRGDPGEEGKGLGVPSSSTCSSPVARSAQPAARAAQTAVDEFPKLSAVAGMPSTPRAMRTPATTASAATTAVAAHR
jgi:hypothetical protein